MHRRGRTMLLWAAVAAALTAFLTAPLAARADGVDQTCELTATRFDADSVNVLFPDSSAQYWSAGYRAVPGTRIRIDGIFPYARYTSWNVYDPVLRPFAKKSDFELAPDAGSANPFLPGADRTTPPRQRHYTLFVTFDPADHPGPNTIYVDPSKNPAGVFTLRVYVPDRGRDSTGGVGLPQVTWEPTSSSGPPSTTSPCRSLEKPSSTTVTTPTRGRPGPAAGLRTRGATHPHGARSRTSATRATTSRSTTKPETRSQTADGPRATTSARAGSCPTSTTRTSTRSSAAASAGSRSSAAGRRPSRRRTRMLPPCRAASSSAIGRSARTTPTRSATSAAAATTRCGSTRTATTRSSSPSQRTGPRRRRTVARRRAGSRGDRSRRE